MRMIGIGHLQRWPWAKPVAVCIGFEAFCALALAGCCIPPNPSTLNDGRASTVAGTDPHAPLASESVVLADRLLRRESDSLLLDARQRRELGHEIERMLMRIRDAYRATAEISVWQAHEPGVLLLGLEPDLFEAASGLLDGVNEPSASRTGHAELDALNSKVGLWAVRPFPFASVVAMYFDEHVNLDAARRAYLKIDGVRTAEPDARAGDGPDIEASKSRGVWHVIVRNAWGDCPAGCTHAEMSFFTVEGGSVDQIKPSQAMSMAEFAALAGIRGWR